MNPIKNNDHPAKRTAVMAGRDHSVVLVGRYEFSIVTYLPMRLAYI